MNADKQLERLEKQLFRDYVRRNPILGSALGLHEEFDEKMPDGSYDRKIDELRFLQRSMRDFQKIDLAKLSPIRAIDREFALYLLKNWIFEIDEMRLWERSPEVPQIIGQGIFQILSRNYAPLGQRLRSIMRRMDRMSKYIDQSRSRLRAPTKVHVEIELETLTRLPGLFNLLRDISREHLPPTPQRDMHRLIEHVQNELQRYEDWLIVDILPDCGDTFALGDGVYRKMLSVRGIDRSPGQLTAAAETEMERVRERQREIARTIRRKVPIEDIRDMIKQQHPENFDGVLRFARETVQKSRQFVTRSHFAALPEGEQLYVIEMPSYRRHFLPLGGYIPPARFESRLDGYFLVTPGDCDSDKLKELNYGSITGMAVREGYPGRHLQTVWALSHPSPLRFLNGLHREPLTVSAWSHYCEERTKEMGHDDTPTSRFMQLQATTLAAARVMVDLRLATGRLGDIHAAENMIDYLGMDRVVAEAEVRRYIRDPGANAGILWGKEKIRELRHRTREKMGNRFSDFFFHTTLLKAGLIPYNLLKRELDLKIAEELLKPAPETKEEAKKPEPIAAGKAKSKAKAAPKPKPKPKSKPKPKAKPKKSAPKKAAPKKPKSRPKKRR